MDWWELLPFSLLRMALALAFRVYRRLLLFAVVAAMGDVSKPGEATAAAAAAHAEAGSRSTATDCRSTAVDALLVGARWDFVRSFDLV